MKLTEKKLRQIIKEEAERLNEYGMNDMSDRERIDTLREAQDLIFRAAEQIEIAMRGTSLENTVDAYIVGHLKNWADGRESTSINELIKDVKNGEI